MVFRQTSAQRATPSLKTVGRFLSSFPISNPGGFSYQVIQFSKFVHVDRDGYIYFFGWMEYIGSLAISRSPLRRKAANGARAFLIDADSVISVVAVTTNR